MEDSIQKISHRHDAIIDWLICYPTRSLRDCAESFGMGVEWLRRLINTDMFQAEYRKRAAETRGMMVWDLKSQIANTASLALEEAAKRLETGVASERFIGDTVKSTLAALGYGSPVAASAAAAQANVTVHVDASAIIAAREQAAAAKQGNTPARLVLDAVSEGAGAGA